MITEAGKAMAQMFYQAVKSGEKTLDEVPWFLKPLVEQYIKQDAKSAEEQAALIAEEQAAATEETKDEKKAKAKAASKKKDTE